MLRPAFPLRHPAARVAAHAIAALLVATQGSGTAATDAGGRGFSPPLQPATAAVRLEAVLEDLTLPVSLLALGEDQVLVVQLDGVVLLVEAGVVRSEPVLELRHRVTAREGEQGFYSVALEGADAARARGGTRLLVAAFAEVGTGDLVVSAFPFDERLVRADAAQELELLRVALPEPYHHGGQVAFAPDGSLFVSVGDGEVANDFLRRVPPSAQSLDTLRGKLLRIALLPEAARGASSRPYAIPSDNPFVGAGRGRHGEVVREEIWAYGLRNPWKFTFHPVTGDPYVVDVGNDRWERVLRAERGADHGWPAREGPECQRLPDTGELVDPLCPSTTYVEPVVTFPHLALDVAGGQAVVGGVFVTDPGLPQLAGRYVFGDFVTGRLWSWDPADDRVEKVLDTGLALTHVAAGTHGEVYLLGVQGVLARLVAADGSASPSP